MMTEDEYYFSFSFIVFFFTEIMLISKFRIQDSMTKSKRKQIRFGKLRRVVSHEKFCRGCTHGKNDKDIDPQYFYTQLVL